MKEYERIICSSIKKLYEEFLSSLNGSPALYDIVVTEISEDNRFYSFWFSYPKEVLNNYYYHIYNFINNTGGKTLMLINNYENKYTSILFEENNKKDDYYEIDPDNMYYSLHDEVFRYKKIKNVDALLNNWNKYVHKNIGISSFMFSKIYYKIDDRYFVSAINTGWNYSTFQKVKKDRILVDKIIEKFLWRHSLNVVATDINRELKKKSILSNVAQISSRNMSHNIGSHVLANLIKYIESEYFQIFGITEESIKEKHDNAKEIEKLISFLEYVMHRMDFLADIATAEPLMEVTSDIFDDVISKFIENDHIKSYITGNERKFEIFYEKKNQGDSFIALPNDLLGSHAIYVILENIIRNTAKHSQISDQKFIIQVLADINEKYPDYVRLLIYDNIKTSNIDSLIKQQNNHLKQSILDKNRDLRREAWGILEMKIAAAYLRKVPLHLIDSVQYAPCEDTNNSKPALLRAINCEGALGYEFYMHKPRECLVILRKNDEYIYFSVAANSHSERLDGFKPTSKRLAPYKIVSIEKESDQNLLKPFSKKITSRLVIGNNSSLSATNIWHQWISHISGKKNISEVSVFKLIEKNSNPELIFKKQVNQFGESYKALFIRHADIPDTQRYDHYEYYPDNSFFHRFLNESDQSEQMEPLLIEGVISKIAILDERIQKFLYETSFKQSSAPSLVDYFELLGINIPQKTDLCLNSEFDPSYYEKISEWIEEKLRSSDFLLIHIGILEKSLQLAKYQDAQKKKRIEEFLHGFNIEKNLLYEKVVFISGRGKPDTIPEDFRFLNFTNLNRFINKNICKTTLVQLLYSARAYS